MKQLIQFLTIPVITLTVGLSSILSFAAEDLPRTADRDVHLKTEDVLQGTVSSCTSSAREVAFTAQNETTRTYRISTSFVYSACVRRQSYKVNLVGKFWNTKEHVIEGTQKVYFRPENFKDINTEEVSVHSYDTSSALAAIEATRTRMMMECVSRQETFKQIGKVLEQTNCRQD